MKKVPFTNPTDGYLHVGAVMVPPHDTRDVDPRLIPAKFRPKADKPADEPPPPPPADPLELVRAGNVKDVTAALPGLSDEELDRIEALENAIEAPRKGVLSAITADRLRRAAGTGGE